MGLKGYLKRYILDRKFTGRTIVLSKHTCWGDNIYFSDYATRSLTGWMTPKPKVGDRIIANMSSGKRGAFQISKVEYVDGISDMFFATVEDIGYEDEI